MTDVIERSWYRTGMGTPNPMSLDQFGQDMAAVREWGEKVNVWKGTDREGSPLKVVWVACPRYGAAILYAYEISGGE